MALRESDPAEVGGYRIEDRLGSGGMGVVYLARSDSGRRLALKVVHAQYADDDAPRPWMATLYIPGEDLGTHVRRHGPLPPPKLYELAAGLAEAIATSSPTLGFARAGGPPSPEWSIAT
ncbi:hypothetical protein [Streptomyces sp. UG1]|uniref:hypothetical protein n=1 Tax=Streptomyces sp. UG1 TaxID=3417652 RepID=UPI003CEA15CE